MNQSTFQVDNLEQPSLVTARQLRQRILALDARLNDTGVAPTGQDYNALFDLVNNGLHDLLTVLENVRRRRP